MKSVILFLCLGIISLSGHLLASETPENPGDNLDLNSVLNLFEKSKSVEDFENKLNSEKNDVNNLDLNNDGYVDYIRIIDYTDGNTHSLTLQVPYSNEEAQDVAVILIEKQDDESTVLQIVGDKDLYGDDYIIEPGNEENNNVVNTANWKVVRHVFAPTYVVWVSPWRFGLYPKWYRPWKPVLWSVYRGYHRNHHIPCRRVTIHRTHRAHSHYHKHRRYSHTYHAHHHKSVNQGHKTHHKPNSVKQPNKNVKSKNTPHHNQKPVQKSNHQKQHKKNGSMNKKSGGNRTGGKRR